MFSMDFRLILCLRVHVAWNWTSWTLEREDTGDVTETEILIIIGICLFKNILPERMLTL